MKIYIVYRMCDYETPLAVSLDHKEAEKFMKARKKQNKYVTDYWIEEKIITNDVTEI